ncbi:hypothetical protein C6A36_00095 [Desulfobacteraceae bacterium SEEP-SAG10]|nr:hypothetical protein C6A36_00095 [Desulfobacteraceae bacterium SEEP-SAG10]
MGDDKIYEIKIEDIVLSDKNVRHSNPMKDLDALAASIKKHGLLQPVVMLGQYGEPPYELIAGQRRFLAHQQILQSKTIKAVFIGSLTKNQAILRSLVENVQRLELNHADTAKAITDLYVAFNKDERKVQKETGLSIRKVRDYIHIEEQASRKMKAKLKKGTVTTADVKRALRAAQGAIKKAEELLDLMEQYPLTKYQKKRVIEYGERHKKASAKTIVKEARRPRVEQKIMISLPEKIRKGLEQATQDLSMEVEEIVADVLENWLSNQGY